MHVEECWYYEAALIDVGASKKKSLGSLEQGTS